MPMFPVVVFGLPAHRSSPPRGSSYPVGIMKGYDGGEEGNAEETCTIFAQLFSMLMQSFSRVANVLVVSALAVALAMISCTCAKA